MVSFAVQNILVWYSFHFLNFAFVAFAFSVKSKASVKELAPYVFF